MIQKSSKITPFFSFFLFFLWRNGYRCVPIIGRNGIFLIRYVRSTFSSFFSLENNKFFSFGTGLKLPKIEETLKEKKKKWSAPLYRSTRRGVYRKTTRAGGNGVSPLACRRLGRFFVESINLGFKSK